MSRRGDAYRGRRRRAPLTPEEREQSLKATRLRHLANCEAAVLEQLDETGPDGGRWLLMFGRQLQDARRLAGLIE